MCAHVQGAPLVDSSEQHPVVLFSHGIGGTRTSYSGICTELGSAVRILLPSQERSGTWVMLCKI